MANNVRIPFNKDAEISLIGSIFLDQSLLNKVSDIIKDDDFYDEKNKVLYKAIKDISKKDLDIDFTSVYTYIQNNQLTNIVNPDYLNFIISSTYSKANVDTYISLVYEASTKRKIILMLEDLIKTGYKNELELNDLIDLCEKKVFDISKSQRYDDFKEAKEILKEVLQQTENASNKKEEIVGLKTGFKKLDQVTLGFQPGQLIILAARPAMGKSAMAINLAVNICTHNKNSKATCAIFSLEMPAESLCERMIAADSQINLQSIKSGNIETSEWVRFNASSHKLSNLNIYFDDSTDLDVKAMRAKCRKLAHEEGLDFVVIDYLQLIDGSIPGKSMQEEVSKVSRALKLMAMELKVPVMALSQLSRAVEKRDDKHPIMADLRDSGSIEQDADIVMFLYRDDYYNKNSVRIGEADLIISKNRNGQTHDGIELVFNGAFSLFKDKNITEF